MPHTPPRTLPRPLHLLTPEQRAQIDAQQTAAERAAADVLRRRVARDWTAAAIGALLVLVLALAGLLPRKVHAQPYVTLGAGASSINGVECPAGATCRRYSKGGQVGLGWQLAPAWGLELVAAELGRATASGTVAGRPAAGSIRGQGLAAFVVPRAAWDGGALYARLGMAYTRTRASGSITGLGSAVAEQDLLRPAWSVGLDIDLAPHVALRIDHLEARGRWQRDGTGALTSAGLRINW